MAYKGYDCSVAVELMGAERAQRKETKRPYTRGWSNDLRTAKCAHEHVRYALTVCSERPFV
jgi:hypothetical protein